MHRIVVILLLFVGGCVTIPRPQVGKFSFDDVSPGVYEINTNKYVRVSSVSEVEILSEPTGRKVVWNDEFIGKTPLKLKISKIRYVWWSEERGYWWDTEGHDWWHLSGRRGFDRIVRISVLPETGEYEQRKLFYSKDAVPRTIYFNMRLKTAPQELDIKIK